ncbi:MAG: Rieske (2Fe-2S) protein [Candidatus Omnitrophica bacterium]|nr:Rieske (2Fe-2S) protein [Candidatus Omnitrophota bacterium]
MTNHTSTPRSQDPEDIKKRNFIKGLTGGVLGLLTLSITWPFVSYLIPTTAGGREERFIKVPNFPDMPLGVPTKMNFQDLEEQAFLKMSTVYDIWVIKHSPTEATVYSPLCPHLNCRYSWDAKQFACPCHGSNFNLAGKCTAGPSPRPLDSLPYKIEGGELFVQWKQFKAGIPDKVEA